MSDDLFRLVGRGKGCDRTHSQLTVLAVQPRVKGMHIGGDTIWCLRKKGVTKSDELKISLSSILEALGACASTGHTTRSSWTVDPTYTSARAI
jgi:hypothetical protein